MPKRVTVIVLLLCLVVAFLPGCSSGTEQMELENPFALTDFLGEGQVVKFSGDASGYMPGDSAEFLVTFINESVAGWSDTYYIQLLDQTKVVATLHEAVISIPSGEIQIFPLSLQLPNDLDKGEYGLAISIPGRMAIATDIYVGVAYQPPSANTTWAEPAL